MSLHSATPLLTAMNLRHLLLGTLLVATAALRAEPLTRDASVYARPEPSATVLKVLPAGTDPVPAIAPAEPAPAGWLAVEVPGPRELFVNNGDVAKNLDVKPGSFFYLRPDRRAPVVATMQPGDKAELANLAGDFTSYLVEKPIVGYIKLSGGVATVPGVPARTPVILSGPAATGEIGRAAMPRFYEGRFAATQNFLAYKHPYNFQLIDSTGNRFAYLDISRLLLTDKVDLFLDRVVIVYGTARTLNQDGTKRVIEVESLHLK
jgi:hypothetical protein